MICKIVSIVELFNTHRLVYKAGGFKIKRDFAPE